MHQAHCSASWLTFFAFARSMAAWTGSSPDFARASAAAFLAARFASFAAASRSKRSWRASNRKRELSDRTFSFAASRIAPFADR